MTADERAAAPPYINEPTRLLVELLGRMIDERPRWRECRTLRTAFDEFDAVCRREPAIIGFIRRSVSGKSGLTLDQIKLIMLATFMRSSSSYGTIPELVVVMNLASDYGLAAKINDNAVHEVGTSRLTSHPVLLLQSFGTLSDAIQTLFQTRGRRVEFPPLAQASHALLRHLFAFQIRRSTETLPAYREFCDFLTDDQIYTPPHTEGDYATACHYAALCDRRIAEYHSAILVHILGMGDRLPANGAESYRRDPTDRRWLAQQAFEFCAREASSADVGDSISYVGAYGLFVRAFLGHVTETARETATKWWWVHSDQEVGESLGWGTTAEQGHARDARELVERVFDGINATNAAVAVRTATAMSHLRLKHWQAVTDRLEELGPRPGAIFVPFNPAEYRPTCIEWNL